MNAVPQTVETEPQVPAAMTPMDMIAIAVQSDASIEKLEKLMQLQERYEANQGRKAFDKAMADAKAEIPVIIKSREVDFVGKTGIRTHYHYEDLAVIAETINPILATHGLSYRYRTSQEADRVTVTCIISHRDGYSEETSLSAAADQSGNKNNIQAVGSTISYLQRMTLKAGMGLAAARDDDGQASGAGTTINDKQFEELQALIDKTGVPSDELCRHLKINSLKAMPITQLDLAVAIIKRRAQEAEKGGAGHE